MHRSGRSSASTRATTARAFATRGYRCVAANPASNETLLGVGGAAAEKACGDLAATLKAFRREPHRFGFSNRVVAETVSMKPIHDIEIKPLPETATLEKPKN